MAYFFLIRTLKVYVMIAFCLMNRTGPTHVTVWGLCTLCTLASSVQKVTLFSWPLY